MTAGTGSGAPERGSRADDDRFVPAAAITTGEDGDVLIPAAPRWSQRRIEVVGTIAILLAALIIGLVRVPREVYDIVWAEDGKTFLADALDPATSWRLLEPYAGYLHLVPRFWALVVVSVLPLQLYAIGVTVVSVLTASVVSAAVFHYSRTVLPWLPARVAAAAVVALLPSAGVEVLGNLANLHWYLLLLTPFLLLFLPRNWGGAVFAGLVALAAALTEIQVAGFLPLALWHLRDRTRWPIIGGFLLGVGAQIATTLSTPRDVPGGELPSAADNAVGYLTNAVGPAVIGDSTLLGQVIAATGWILPAVLLVLAVAAVLVVMSGGTSAQRFLAVLLVPASVVLWSSAYLSNIRVPNLLFASYSPEVWAESFVPTRHGVVPGGLLLLAVVLAADVIRRSPDIRPWPWAGAPRDTAAVLLVGLVAVMAVGSTSVQSVRTDGDEWSRQVREGIIACSGGGDPAAEWILETAPAQWVVALPCSEL